MNERIMQFIKFLSLSVSDFEKSVGLSNGAVSKIGDNTRRSTIDRISIVYPDLNTSWLLTGEGEMLRSRDIHNGDNSTQILGNNHVNSSETLNKAIDEIAEQRKLVSKSQEQLSKSQEQIDRLIAIIEKLNQVNVK